MKTSFNLWRTISCAFVCGLLSACVHTPLLSSSASDFWQDTSLSQTLAEWRAKRVSDVTYRIDLGIDKKSEEFSGREEIQFQLTDTKTDLPLDFEDGQIVKMTVNGKAVSAKRGPLFVRIPRSALKIGQNEITVSYSHPYSHTGEGLHRFEDPEDHSIYMYTQFEPFDANRFAPMFDQPDIKAKLTLSVLAPSDWKVIGNMKVKKESTPKGVDHFTQWQFQETPPISTYLFVMVAGPYVVYHDSYKGMPLRLFARKKIAKYVDHKEWFKITKEGLAYYEKFFGIKYPFQKYDQLIVPEFNAGAMENVGAITFTERYLKRGGYTRNDRMLLADTILHEMAHQWFGDLVTMKWWNDLWLNESFATFMSGLAETHATQYKEAWLEFQTDKIDAFWQDQLVTTHPISGEVKNTNQAFTSFDNITYGKGASVLKELYYTVGDAKFRAALADYFSKHSYKNATLADFEAAFNETTGNNMTDWFTNWLTTTGVDEIQASLNCSPEKYEVVVHNYGAHPRTHILRVGRYKYVSGHVDELGATEFITGTKEATATVHPGAKVCPDFVYPNTDDLAYVKVLFDKKDIAFLKSHINQIPDAVTRVAIWQDLWQMVRDQKLKLNDFAEMAMSAWQKESNPSVLSYLAHRTFGYGRHISREQYDSVYYFWPRSSASDKAALRKWQQKYAAEILARINREKPNGDLAKSLFDFYLAAAAEPSQAKPLMALYKKTSDQDRRWAALAVLCRIGEPSCGSLIKEELKRDSSDRGQKAALGCQAAVPKSAVKEGFLAKLRAKTSPFSADESSYVLANLFPASESHLLSKYADEIYDSLHSTWLHDRDETVQGYLAADLAPVYCDSNANNKLKSELNQNAKTWPSSLRVELLQRWDEDRRCILVRAFNR